MGCVQKKAPEEMREGDFETADDLRNIELFPESQLAPAKHFDGHQDLPLERANTEAVKRTLTTEIGNSPSQPNRIS